MNMKNVFEYMFSCWMDIKKTKGDVKKGIKGVYGEYVDRVN